MIHLHQLFACVKGGEWGICFFGRITESVPIRPGVDFWRLREKNHPVSSLGFLAAVNVVIWVGLFFYLWRIDRRIAEKERES